MATKTLNTRLQLKYDTYENWTKNNPTLLAGEIAITTIPSATGDVKQAPSVLMKVGDGVNTYQDLKYVSGLAANVSAWALAETKPTYAASEITGLEDFINGEIQDTNTTYQIVQVDDYNYKLQSKELGGAWKDTGSTIVIPKYDDTTVKADISALQKLVGSTAVATQISNAISALKLADTYDAKGAAATAESNAKKYTDALANGTVATNTAAITAIKDGETLDSFKDVEGAIATAKTEASTAAANALKDAKTYADGKDTAIADAKKAGTDAQTAVNTLSGKVGTVPTGKTVVQMISEAQTAATYDDTAVKADIKAIKDDYLKAADKTELSGKITTVEGKVTTLIGEDANKSVRTIANEELTKQLIPEGAKDSLDTLQEIAAWIQKHPDDVATMNKSISDNAANITSVTGRVTTAEGKIKTLEGASHTHSNKALLDTYTQTEANLKDAVAKKHSHANATVLDGITAAKVSAWDSAETNAKKAVTDLANGAVKTNTNAIAAIKDGTTLDSFKDVEDKFTADATAIADAKKAGTDAQTAVNTLAGKAVQDGETVILNCGNSVIA